MNYMDHTWSMTLTGWSSAVKKRDNTLISEMAIQMTKCSWYLLKTSLTQNPKWWLCQYGSYHWDLVCLPVCTECQVTLSILTSLLNWHKVNTRPQPQKQTQDLITVHVPVGKGENYKLFLKFKIVMHISSWSTVAQGLRSKDRIKHAKVHSGPEGE